VLRAGIDGTITGLDYKAVIEILKMYDEGKEMFDEILFCWGCEQEMRHGQ